VEVTAQADALHAALPSPPPLAPDDELPLDPPLLDAPPLEPTPLPELPDPPAAPELPLDVRTAPPSSGS
jgi:hypothetical protein